MGRDRELAAAAAARAAGSGGIWLSGAAGVGKTRLAHEIVGRHSAAGSSTRWLSVTPGMAAVPLGPFRHLLDPAGGADAAEDALWAALDRALHDDLESGNLVVVIDDAHHLDDLSAAYVHRLAARDERSSY